MSDIWLSTWPGTEPAMFLAIARQLLETEQIDREFVRRWVNWEQTMAERHPDEPQTFDGFLEVLKGAYAEFTFESAAEECGIDPDQLAEVAQLVAEARAPIRLAHLALHRFGNLGGWQAARPCGSSTYSRGRSARWVVPSPAIGRS